MREVYELLHHHQQTHIYVGQADSTGISNYHLKKERHTLMLHCTDDRFDEMPVAFCSPCLIHKKENKVAQFLPPSCVFFPMNE